MIEEREKKCPHVSIIILNWNGWKDTINCLKSIFQINYINYDVIMVDNHSSDKSVHKIREYCKMVEYGFFEYNYNENLINGFKTKDQELKANKSLILIKNEKNYGFAEGNNIGIRYVFKNLNSPYFLLLNNDTIVDKNFLNELIKIAESDENIGSVQSLLLRPGGKIIDSLGQEISIWGAKDKGINSKFTSDIKNTEIFGSCAAASLYRSEIFKEVGLFDNDFFIILEDVDFSWRMRMNGFKSFLASKSIVYHKRGISEEMSIKEILFGEKTPETIFKWYHTSKNWLIIVIRYYSMSLVGKAIIKEPHKFFFTFFRLIYSSLKMQKFREAYKILSKNLKIRKNNKNNPLLRELQSKWIND